MTENQVKKEVKKILNTYGAWYFMPSQTGLGRRGIPDFIGVLKGGFGFGIECKGTGGVVSKAQRAELVTIGKAGGFYFIAYPESIEHLEEDLKNFYAARGLVL